jgi:hypothetical protein
MKPILILPCKYDFKKMKDSSTGKHCQNCDRHIQDYRNLTEEGLVEKFKSSEGVHCGHFNLNQLSFKQTLLNISNYKAITLSVLSLFLALVGVVCKLPIAIGMCCSTNKQRLKINN